MKTREIDAVVFDLDGLLVDSEPVQIDAWHRFLERHQQRLTDEVLHRMYGLRVWDAAQLLIDAFSLSMTVDDVVAERDALFFEMLPGRLSAMPGAGEIVRDARELGLRLALATSGHRRYVDLVLQELGLARAFDIETTGDMVERGKPAPDIYLAAANGLGVRPDRCVALEDAPNGVASAKDAGMLCLAIPNQMTTHVAGFERADAQLASLNEVVTWLRDHVEIVPVRSFE